MNRAENSETIGNLLSNLTQQYGDKVAITYLESDDLERKTELTFRQLCEQCEKVAQIVTHRLGLSSDEVVGMLLPNIPETQLILWGVQQVAILAPLNPLLSPTDLEQLLRKINAKALFVYGPSEEHPLWRLGKKMHSSIEHIDYVVRVGGMSTNQYDGVFDLNNLMLESDSLSIDDKSANIDSAYFHTGGTTGSPKVAPISQANQLAAVRAAGTQLGYTSADVVLAPLPLFHIAGALIAGLAPLANGARIVMAGAAGFRDVSMLQSCWRIIENERVTIMAAVPTSLAALSVVELDGADTSTLDYILTGTAPLPDGVSKSVQNRCGVNVREGYGMTESAGAVAFSDRYQPAPEGSVGKAGLGIDLMVAIVGEHGPELKPVAIGERGAVLVRGDTVFSGYLGSQSQDRFVGDGWFDTGDLGFFDEERNLFLTGRSKDIIIRSGHNIDPSVIEDVALKHESILQAAAVGRPDPYAGEVPVLFVVPSRMEGHHKESELMEYLAENVSEPPARPKAIYYVQELPLTAVGKIFKPELRRHAAEIHFKEVIGLADFNSDDVEVALLAGGALKVTIPQNISKGDIAPTMSSYKVDIEYKKV